jgi:hypothetical protein
MIRCMSCRELELVHNLLVFAEYASDDSWIAVHIGQFAGVIITLKFQFHVTKS